MPYFGETTRDDVLDMLTEILTPGDVVHIADNYGNPEFRFRWDRWAQREAEKLKPEEARLLVGVSSDDLVDHLRRKREAALRGSYGGLR